MELVEQHRLHLHYNNARTIAEQERATASLNQAVRTQAAIDFIVKRLVPEKLIAMARTRRSRAPKGGVAGAKSSGLRRRANLGAPRASSPELGPGPGQPPSSTQGPAPSTAQSPPQRSSVGEGKEEGAQKSSEPLPVVPPAQESSGRKWGVAADKVTMDKMPFMPAWGATIKKLKKEDGVGWDEVMGGHQNSLQGGGVQIYVIKCQELGVIPSTQVVQQLRQAECDMGHCQLGRRGAQALRHALAVNTSITDLNLMDNGLDAQALAEIVTGLTYGSTALRLQGLAGISLISMDLVKHVPHSADVAVNVLPPSLRGQAGGTSKAQSGQAAPGPSQPGGAPGGQPGGPPETSGSKKTGMQVEQRGSPSGPKSPPRSRSQSPTKKKRQNRVPIVPHRSNVQILDLSLNPLGMNGGRLISELLDPQQTPHQFLVELRLDKCGLAEASGLAIARALQNFNQTLKVLSMSNNALGNKTAAAFGELLKENTTLTDLDLSWNQIKAEGVKGLRPGLEGSLSLKTLSLAWNGLENEGAIAMGQILVNNASLVSLDLTNTRLGSEACVMLGEGIKANTTLEELLLNGNAIGDDGARHLMAALKSNKTLECLSLQGSNMSTAARGHNGAAEFNPLAPEGSYTLALDNPTDRAVAAQLCKFDLTSAKGPLMHNIKVDDQSMKGVREMDWPAKLPSSGLLEFDFVARKIQNMVQVMDNKKFMAVVFQLESKTMADVEKLTLVEIIAPFTYLYCHQIASILRCFSMGDEVVRAAALLFTRAADLEENLDALTSALQDYDVLSLQQMLGWFSYCRFSNPTVASSQSFDWRPCNLVTFPTSSQVPSNYGPPDSWKGVIPTRGTVSFDYVSTTRPPPEALPIGDEELLDFLHVEIGLTLNNTGGIVPEEDYSTADMQLAVLRQEAGHRFWFTCAQVLRIMNAFLAGPHRVEVAVMMWALILDRKDFWTILYSLPPFEQALLMWRLGPLNVLDKAHPSAHYVLDLSNNLHEQVCGGMHMWDV
ncbi:hypothetical protein DUNSADRAFT_3505 [Dunaliella salina]|uniref:DUF4476 domain-containing protein n=1 Tax=Dunaliella salina TaxID=3046 RepID=A0ABQ7GTU3_DUNSA|nr:hypothetical protein DUNSADRAFT_3505 [Dunaliella salina]|eukprot:KAF5838018.1 hypothetical protein DUNSADRAFT_3505 [Dunaliella salina]